MRYTAVFVLLAFLCGCRPTEAEDQSRQAKAKAINLDAGWGISCSPGPCLYRGADGRAIFFGEYDGLEWRGHRFKAFALHGCDPALYEVVRERLTGVLFAPEDEDSSSTHAGNMIVALNKRVVLVQDAEREIGDVKAFASALSDRCVRDAYWLFADYVDRRVRWTKANDDRLKREIQEAEDAERRLQERVPPYRRMTR
jgi:hypothetical protein